MEQSTKLTEEQVEAITDVISEMINRVKPITFEELLKYATQGD